MAIKVLKLVGGSFQQQAANDDLSTTGTGTIASATSVSAGTSVTATTSLNGATLAVSTTSTFGQGASFNGGATVASGQTLTLTGGTLAGGAGVTVSGTWNGGTLNPAGIGGTGSWLTTGSIGGSVGTFSGMLNANGGITVPTSLAVAINGTSTLAVGGTSGFTGLTTHSGGLKADSIQPLAVTDTMLIGSTLSGAGAITLGSASSTVSIPGNLTVTGVQTFVGGTTFGPANVIYGPSAAATGPGNQKDSILAQFTYNWWNTSSTQANGYALKAVPSANTGNCGDLTFLDAGTTPMMKLEAVTGHLHVNSTVDVMATGTLHLGTLTTPTANLIQLNTASDHKGLATFSAGMDLVSGQTFDATGAFITAGTLSPIAVSATGLVTSTGNITTTSTGNIQSATTITAGTGLTVSSGTVTLTGTTVALGGGTTVTGTANVQGATIAAGTGVTASGQWNFTGTPTVTGLVTANGGIMMGASQTLTLGTGTPVLAAGTANLTGTLTGGTLASTTINNATIGGSSSITTTGAISTSNASGVAITGTGVLGVAGLSTLTGGAATNSVNALTAGAAMTVASNLTTGTLGIATTNTGGIQIGGASTTTTFPGNVSITGTLTGASVGTAANVTVVGLSADATGVASAFMAVCPTGSLTVGMANGAANTATAVVLGFADSAKTSATVGVITAGIVNPPKATNNSGSWAVGSPVYLSAAGGGDVGKVTDVAPAAGVLLRVGYAVSATQMLIAMASPVVL